MERYIYNVIYTQAKYIDNRAYIQKDIHKHIYLQGYRYKKTHTNQYIHKNVSIQNRHKYLEIYI